MNIPISNESKEFMNILYPHTFNHLCRQNYKDHFKRLEPILKKIYKQFKASQQITLKLYKKNHVKRELIALEDKSVLKMNSLFQLTENVSEIREYIYNNITHICKYSFRLFGRLFVLHFSIFSLDDLPKYDSYARIIVQMLAMLGNNGSLKCSETLHIYLSLTPFTKNMPEQKFSPITEEHVNSALTYVCRKEGEIFIFREEEWLKVLIHECFHSFGLDFSNFEHYHINNTLKQFFKVEIEDFNLTESYCEFWATILNGAFLAFRSSNNFTDFSSYFHYITQLEITYSLFQMNKILQYNDITYHMITNSASVQTYRLESSTSTFSYYIIKTILLFNYHLFLLYCDANNTNLFSFVKSRKNINDFVRFIRFNHNTTTFYKEIDNVRLLIATIVDKQKTDRSHERLMTTMKMTLFEHKIESI